MSSYSPRELDHTSLLACIRVRLITHIVPDRVKVHFLQTLGDSATFFRCAVSNRSELLSVIRKEYIEVQYRTWGRYETINFDQSDIVLDGY